MRDRDDPAGLEKEMKDGPEKVGKQAPAMGTNASSLECHLGRRVHGRSRAARARR